MKIFDAGWLQGEPTEKEIKSFIEWLWETRYLLDTSMRYVGLARLQQAAGTIQMAARLMPTGTEYLHIVRYLDVQNSRTQMAPRRKELRYSRKNSWLTYHQPRTIADKEIKERHDFPDRTKVVTGNMETRLNLPHGWTYQGFIEDDLGELRPQTYEESYFCTGCHGYIGASNDTTLSFTRKFGHEAFRGGWYHWAEKGFSGTADHVREDGEGEFAYYLKQNPTGNEYRTNSEVLSLFFASDGSPRPTAFAALAQDISTLLMPSAERAVLLNKAYRVVVAEQSFHLGREAVVEPLINVYESVDIDQETGIVDILSHY